MGMPGHMGDERVTVQNLQVMQVREAEKIILISGAVPGRERQLCRRSAGDQDRKNRAQAEAQGKHERKSYAKKPSENRPRRNERESSNESSGQRSEDQI